MLFNNILYVLNRYKKDIQYQLFGKCMRGSNKKCDMIEKSDNIIEISALNIANIF